MTNNSTDTPRTTRTRMETAHLLCDSDDFEDVISTLKKEGAELERELDEARAELAELWTRFDQQMAAELSLSSVIEIADELIEACGTIDPYKFAQKKKAQLDQIKDTLYPTKK